MSITLDRVNLYTDVWHRPIGHLARDLGISASKLREACKVLDVPLPGHGHWAAVRAGRGQPPPPLPTRTGQDTLTIGAAPRESLVDWVKRTTPLQTKVSVQPLPGQGRPPTGPRLVTLGEWAVLLMGDHAPHSNTLLRWVHDGRITPAPRKIGRRWFVEPHAEYTGD